MDETMALWPGGPLFRQSSHARLGTDTVLLADFIRPGSRKKGIDLGCGSGAVMLLLLQRTGKLHMTGLELIESAANTAQRNLDDNGLTGRGAVICGDLREHRRLFPGGSFDLAAANPPYFPVSSGALSPEAQRAQARSELSCTLEQLCDCAAYLLQTGGSFSLVYRPERLSELFVCLSSRGLEPKRLRFVCPEAASAPSLALVEARRGGKCGLTVEAPLILRDPDGTETEELKRIYHRID